MNRQRKIIAVLLMCCGLSLLGFSPDCIGVQSNLQLVYAEDEEREDWKQPKREGASGTDEPEGDRDFYRVIVENNLFRPLGWRKPNRDPEYALIATWIGAQGKVAKALVMERKSNQLYYVSRGEKVGDATVKKIEANQVSLNASGEVVTLQSESMQFLSGSGGSGDKSREGGPPGASAERPGDERRGRGEGRRGGNRQNFDRMREKLRNASPAERRRMIQEMRKQRGGGKRGGGGERRGGGKDGGKDDDGGGKRVSRGEEKDK